MDLEAGNASFSLVHRDSNDSRSSLTRPPRRISSFSRSVHARRSSLTHASADESFDGSGFNLGYSHDEGASQTKRTPRRSQSTGMLFARRNSFRGSMKANIMDDDSSILDHRTSSENTPMPGLLQGGAGGLLGSMQANTSNHSRRSGSKSSILSGDDNSLSSSYGDDFDLDLEEPDTPKHSLADVKLDASTANHSGISPQAPPPKKSTWCSPSKKTQRRLVMWIWMVATFLLLVTLLATLKHATGGSNKSSSSTEESQSVNNPVLDERDNEIQPPDVVSTTNFEASGVGTVGVDKEDVDVLSEEYETAEASVPNGQEVMTEDDEITVEEAIENINTELEIEEAVETIAEQELNVILAEEQATTQEQQDFLENELSVLKDWEEAEEQEAEVWAAFDEANDEVEIDLLEQEGEVILAMEENLAEQDSLWEQEADPAVTGEERDEVEEQLTALQQEEEVLEKQQMSLADERSAHVQNGGKD